MVPGGGDAHTKRQFVTEYTNINNLADHQIWSTIKTLPATLPEVPGRAADVIHHSTSDPRRGLLMLVGNQHWVLFEGWGLKETGLRLTALWVTPSC